MRQPTNIFDRKKVLISISFRTAYRADHDDNPGKFVNRIFSVNEVSHSMHSRFLCETKHWVDQGLTLSIYCFIDYFLANLEGHGELEGFQKNEKEIHRRIINGHSFNKGFIAADKKNL